MKKIILSGFLFILIFTTCKTTKQAEKVLAQPALDCSSKDVTYSFDIKPVFETFCFECHGDKEEEGGYNFMKISEIKRAAESGALLGSIKWERGFSRMPEHAPQLDAKTINKIECWIKNGMKD